MSFVKKLRLGVECKRQWLHQQGLDLKVYDGWRSMTLQENLFWYYMKLYTSKKFGMHEEFDKLDAFQDIKNFFKSLPQSLKMQMDAANKVFVSWPSSDVLCPSPHATGGAVDVWLFKDDKPLDLGVPFDWMYENAGAFYHFKLLREQFANDRNVCKHRNVLLLAMLKAGFTCYGPEIWHFNYGNQMDSLVTKKIAQYSYIEP
jgi:D-alanyl-D-alanine dipeptidase